MNKRNFIFKLVCINFSENNSIAHAYFYSELVKLVNKSIYLLTLGLLLVLASSAQAHFQVLFTPNTTLLRGEDLHFNLIFSHVFAGGPTMPMAKPQKFYFVKRNNRSMPSEEVDLLEYLRPLDWHTNETTVQSWEGDIPRELTRSLGDYQFVVEPTPYLEEAEGLYIQQFTKMMLNVGGVPGNWYETVGLPAEIHALNKPYALWTGGVFRGQVLSDGIPVPYAQVEIEYLNHPLDLVNNTFYPKPEIAPPHPSLGAQVLLANEFGEFSFALPKAGWWGFAALTVGPQTEYQGLPLSQDAILWVQVTDLPISEAVIRK
jgi:cobalt/nickel transport protein